MKITKVSYGRTIEVGGPFGRRPVEKVWFGWEMEIDPDLESEQEATSRLRCMADEREQEERQNFDDRVRERRNGRSDEKRERGRFVILKATVRVRDGDWFLQHSSRDEVVWGAEETAYVASSKEDAVAFAGRRGLTHEEYDVLGGVLK